MNLFLRDGRRGMRALLAGGMMLAISPGAPAQSAAEPVQMSDSSTGQAAGPSIKTPSQDPASTGPCQIVNVLAKQSGATPLLAAICGKAATLVGEATSYATAWNAASSSLLVVRQQPYRTFVSAVKVAADGTLQAIDMTLGLQRQLGKSGRPQSPMLAVDTGLYAATGAISVAPLLSPAIKVTRTPPSTEALSVDLTEALTRKLPAAPPSSPLPVSENVGKTTTRKN